MIEMQAQERLNNPFLNKGTGFTAKERQQYGLEGLLPPVVRTIEQQAEEVYRSYQNEATALGKREFLMHIFDTNRRLFFYVFSQHVAELLPIVYDPTIAESIKKYSHIYQKPQGAVFLSMDEAPDKIQTSLLAGAAGRDIRLIVVTDAEGILGIGDWGVQGVDIAVGKLMVYTAAAGIDPTQVLPVIIDAGTNNQSLLDDPLYLGNRHPRITGAAYDGYIDAFVAAVKTAFPQVYLHWEDLGRDHAAQILQRYQDQLTTFNDDIQGTGIITLAGVLGALKISGQKLADQRYIQFGAGTAGAGIVKRMYDEMREQGLDDKTAKAHFYLVDKQGLLFEDTPGLTPEQRPFARRRSEFDQPDDLVDLLSVVKAVHPTILVGTSTVAGAFTEQVVREMATHTDRPIIFPISNPTEKMEAKAADLIRWTNGRALVATGIPSEPVTYDGVTYNIGQANNALVYPGLALGTIASTASRLSDEMISAAAHSLGGIVDAAQRGAAVLPPVEKLTEFSQAVAIATARAAVKQGVNMKPISDVPAAVTAMKWTPQY
ncbi:NAD-dependent malic enzyme 3 [Secundilactobacillus kimchicus JCM 15530]|uniref:Malolactic enzyme n=2 Tax=Secundilactobacillus kimchicus TaxID=528209 RepID=A0A0R1HPG0_9LACO|nr:NAD-dependent malic enzyme 3 [Secundilactobacillus kimchicus JCM 15530]